MRIKYLDSSSTNQDNNIKSCPRNEDRKYENSLNNDNNNNSNSNNNNNNNNINIINSIIKSATIWSINNHQPLATFFIKFWYYSLLKNETCYLHASFY